MHSANTASVESEDDRLLHRFLFFSDAVFAIVLTLLALDLRPPDAADQAGFSRGLAQMAGHISAFLMSFALVGVFWLAHMNALRRLSHFDWPTAITNLILLGFVSLMPFSSSLLGHDQFGDVSWRIYCWNLIATSSVMVVMSLVTTRGAGRLVGGASGRERLYRASRAAAPGVAFGLSLILLEFGYLRWANFAFLLIPLQFLLAERVFKPRSPPVTL